MDKGTKTLVPLLNESGKSTGKGWEREPLQPRLEPVETDQRLTDQRLDNLAQVVEQILPRTKNP